MVSSKKIITNKPVSVLQVFHNFVLYKKDQKSYENRKDQSKWKSVVTSKSSEFKEDKLFLSNDDYNPDLQNCDLVILNDFNDDSEENALKKHSKRWSETILKREKDNRGIYQNTFINVQYFNLIGSQRKFEIFKLKKMEDLIELHLCYDAFEIGEPKRDNFKLCNLEKDVPVEIKINGKLDHTLTGGTERTYKEHCYIFHLLGSTNTFELMPTPQKPLTKKIPIPDKTIDLMKVLY